MSPLCGYLTRIGNTFTGTGISNVIVSEPQVAVSSVDVPQMPVDGESDSDAGVVTESRSADLTHCRGEQKL